MLLKLILIVNVFLNTATQERDMKLYCSRQPNRALQAICEQMEMWKRAVDADRPLLLPDPVSEQTEESLFGVKPCDNFYCLCKLAGGYYDHYHKTCEKNNRREPMTKVIRKEYRMLSDSERTRFHQAIKKLHDKGLYNEMVRNHHQNKAYGAHGGAAFLPWHREFLKQFEFALRTIDGQLSIPYWDSTMDEPLPVSADSLIWTDQFMGTTDHVGNVITGYFSSWPTTNGYHYIQRNVGGFDRYGASPFSQKHLAEINSRQTFSDLARCPVTRDPAGFEMTHGLGHLWIGGHMFNTSVSPNDPSFFLHHSFVDYLWEQWRLRKQSRRERESDYPLCCLKVSWLDDQCDIDHGPTSPMHPFISLTNKDGLRNHYTDVLYSYEQSPVCSRERPSCGSPYLFCDTEHGWPRCLGKVKIDGYCNGFEGQAICYQGECINKRCVTSTTTASPTPPFDHCYNEHQCCDAWANGGHCALSSRMLTSCQPSCGLCTPRYGKMGCKDYHYECLKRTLEGKCQTHRDWMGENCRKSCRLCSQLKCSGAPVRSSVAVELKLPVHAALKDKKCEDSWKYHNGFCYQGLFQTKTWDEARGACSRMAIGTVLVPIDSEIENQFIFNNIVKGKANVEGWWIGIKKDKDDKFRKFIGTDSDEISYINFADGEPNNGLIKDGCISYWYEQENCVEMHGNYTKNGKWNDAKCRRKKPFICKTYMLGT